MADSIEDLRAKLKKSKARYKRLASMWSEAARPLAALIDSGKFGPRGDNESNLEVAVRVMTDLHGDCEAQKADLECFEQAFKDGLEELEDLASTMETKMAILEAALVEDSSGRGRIGFRVEMDPQSLVVRAFGQVFECEIPEGRSGSKYLDTAWSNMGNSIAGFLRGRPLPNKSMRTFVYPDQVPTEDDCNDGCVVGWHDGIEEWGWLAKGDLQPGCIWRSLSVPGQGMLARSATLDEECGDED